MEDVIGVDVVHSVRENAHRLPRVVSGSVAKPADKVFIATKLVGGKPRNEATVNDAIDDKFAIG